MRQQVRQVTAGCLQSKVRFGTLRCDDANKHQACNEITFVMIWEWEYEPANYITHILHRGDSPPKTDRHAHVASLQCLSRLVQAYGSLSDVEEYKVFGLVGDEGPEVAADNAVPGGTIFMIEKCLHKQWAVISDV